MTIADFDSILANRLKTCGHHELPPDFADRLATSVRRTRRRFRLTLALWTGLAALLLLGFVFMGLSHPPAKTAQATSSLVATTNTAHTNQNVTGWMLLGFLRQCFTRPHTPKRKEEE